MEASCYGNHEAKQLMEAICTGVIDGSYLLGVINGSGLRDPHLFVILSLGPGIEIQW
jgi:hypothetical protein